MTGRPPPSPLRHDHLEIFHPGGRIEFFPLAPSRGITNIGGHPANQLVLPGLRPFHAILDHRQEPYCLIILGTGAKARQLFELQPGDTLWLEQYTLVLLPAPSPAGQAVPGVSPPAQAAGPVPLPSPAAAQPEQIIQTHLIASRGQVDVEQQAFYQIEISNRGATPAAVITGVEGIEPGWLHIAPPVQSLAPGAAAAVTVTITPPRSSTSQAGRRLLTITVTSPDYPDLYNRHPVSLTINPFYELAIGELAPHRQGAAWFNPASEVLLTVTNRGNSETPARIEAAAEDRACSFEFRVPGEKVSLARQVELNLPAGKTIYLPVRIEPLSRRLVGFGRQPCYFTITASALSGPLRSRTLLGQVNTAPLFGPGSLALAGLVLIVLAALTLPFFPDRPPADELPLEPSELAAAENEQDALFLAMWARLKEARAVKSGKADVAGSRNIDMSYEEMFKEIAPQYGLDWRLLAAQAYQESRLDHLAIGRDSDMGLMQIIPTTWDEWAPQVGASDPFDPYSNVLVAAAYLAYLRDYCRDRGYADDKWMLAAYNWGPDNVRRVFDSSGDWEQVPERTRRYVLTILQARQD